MLAIISFRGGPSGLRKRQLRELLRAIDELAAVPESSIAAHGAVGTKGSLSILDRGFILHAYFVGPTIEFECYGPFAPGTEREPRPPGACPGLTGSMDTACLKEVVGILERGRSPLDYLSQNALESAAVGDDA